MLSQINLVHTILHSLAANPVFQVLISVWLQIENMTLWRMGAVPRSIFSLLKLNSLLTAQFSLMSFDHALDITTLRRNYPGHDTSLRPEGRRKWAGLTRLGTTRQGIDWFKYRYNLHEEVKTIWKITIPSSVL